MVVLDNNPLEEISNTRAIHAVVKNGKIYFRADLDAILKELSDYNQQAQSFVEKLTTGNVKEVLEKVTATMGKNSKIQVLSEEGLLAAAYLFASKKDMGSADLLVQFARKLHPESYLSAYFHAGLFSMAGNAEKEQEALEEVLRLEPRHEQARRRLK